MNLEEIQVNTAQNVLRIPPSKTYDLAYSIR